MNDFSYLEGGFPKDMTHAPILSGGSTKILVRQTNLLFSREIRNLAQSRIEPGQPGALSISFAGGPEPTPEPPDRREKVAGGT